MNVLNVLGFVAGVFTSILIFIICLFKKKNTFIVVTVGIVSLLLSGISASFEIRFLLIFAVLVLLMTTFLARIETVLGYHERRRKRKRQQRSEEAIKKDKRWNYIGSIFIWLIFAIFIFFLVFFEIDILQRYGI